MGRPMTVNSNQLESLGGWAKRDDYEFKLLDIPSMKALSEMPNYKVLKYKDAIYLGQT